ncbi:MAG TPA: acetyl-CoA carboxylase, carboxyltransferase subunit beta [Vicinamibacteria bacterium]|nr:acetyl-CoA carboxylase, carboxyltransferase subunit beta [Vicinamibacteria bacterium]
MSWFKKEKTPLSAVKKSRMPEGLWTKCRECAEILYTKEIVRNLSVCPKCNYHMGLSCRERARTLFDDGRYEELERGLCSTDPLRFSDTKRYGDRLKTSRNQTGLDDAVLVARGRIGGIPVLVSIMEYQFIGGSMGVVVGEKITRAVERALSDRVPLIIVSRSGGARMQEGAISLMQMAKISAALSRLDEARVPYFSILTDPTTGGVTASFAMLGDLNIAEPKALIGFAGPRVIEQTIRQPLPAGFQRSEYLLAHGMLDLIVERRQLKETLEKVLRFFTHPSPSVSRVAQPSHQATEPIRALEKPAL